jgi:hypothetical protein
MNIFKQIIYFNSHEIIQKDLLDLKTLLWIFKSPLLWILNLILDLNSIFQISIFEKIPKLGLILISSILYSKVSLEVWKFSLT